jgi:hypothetical protein
MSGERKVFKAELKIVQDCDEVLTVDQAHQWLEEYFVGSDLGEVTVLSVYEAEDEDE